MSQINTSNNNNAGSKNLTPSSATNKTCNNTEEDDSANNKKSSNSELNGKSPEKNNMMTCPNSIIINVGGRKYEVLSKNFANFPGSRLWKVVHCTALDDILNHCDRYRLVDPEETPEFFFDRSWNGFAHILDAYRSGHLHLNNNNCAYLTRDDLRYWGIDELLVEPCCAVKYYPEIEICMKEIDMEESEKLDIKAREDIENFGDSFLGKIRKYLWDLFEYPHTSRAAQGIALWSLFMIIVSTACFILSTDYDFKDSGGGGGGTRSSNSSTSGLSDRDETTLRIIIYVDYFTAVYFTLEYVIRFVCTPQKLRFFVDPMNMIDLLAILPYFVTLVLTNLSEFHIIGKAGKILRLVRVTRILRVFKLVRHFAGLQSLFFTVKQVYKELGMLVMLVGISVLTFSSLVYFAEKEKEINEDGVIEKGWSFIDSFWWGLMTVTTVGNGTKSPTSGAGRFIGAFCALFGIFTITLPIPIVVNSFAAFYRNRLWRNEVAFKKKERIANNQTPPNLPSLNRISDNKDNSDMIMEMNGI
ncbi:potassium voltage-gated channel protein Shab isoform X2 [Lepeophtheirus salmonis]|uniref:potassium voltage-gated channel protein Shab isoform X2 n=1 Tax=Lepeophtheirus salmonis TaxID=72036 RepID=UPI001AEA79E4|nr:potassium voltage-gated channel protein Shab-like isoform X2 [Lepeophtheirus salmonis]